MRSAEVTWSSSGRRPQVRRCAVLTGRWRRTTVAGLWAVACGAPGGIFGTGQHLALIASVVVAAVVTTIAAAVDEGSRRAPATPVADWKDGVPRR